MTTRDIQEHLQEIYGVDVSPELISRVTDVVHEDVRAMNLSYSLLGRITC